MRASDGWIAVGSVPLVRHHGESDGAPAVLAMLLRYWDLPFLTEDLTFAPGFGLSALTPGTTLRRVASDHGLAAWLGTGTLEQLEANLSRGRPAIVALVRPMAASAASAHYELVVGLHPERKLIATLDPLAGRRLRHVEEFLAQWRPTRYLLITASVRRSSTLLEDAGSIARAEGGGSIGRETATPARLELVHVEGLRLEPEVALVHDRARRLVDVEHAEGVAELVGDGDGALVAILELAVDDDVTGLVFVEPEEGERRFLEADGHARGIFERLARQP